MAGNDLFFSDSKRLAEVARCLSCAHMSRRVFDDLVQLAADLCGSRAAVLSLIAEGEQTVVSEFGLGSKEVIVCSNFCQTTMLGKGVFIPEIEDNLNDRSRSGPEDIGFYAGLPIVLHSGSSIGTLSVINPAPMELSGRQISSLKALGRQIVNQFEYLMNRALKADQSRLSKRQLEIIKEQHADSEILRYSSELGLWKWYLEDNSFLFDRRCCEILGYKITEIDQHFEAWKELLHPDDLDATVKRYQDYLQGNQVQCETTFRMKHKRGHWIHILSKGKVIEQNEFGQPSLFCGTHFDLSHIKAMEADKQLQEEELREAHQLLFSQKQALDSAAIVAETDLRGRITYANDKFLELSGYDRSELLGKDHRILNSGHHPSSFFAELWSTIQRGQVWSGEVKNRAKDGTIYWVDTTVFPIKSQDGKNTKYVSIRFDISDRKRAEEQLRLAMRSAEKANEVKGQFLANMSHEIRTPLNAILGFADVLSETPLTEEQWKYLETLKGSGDTLLNIINDILDLSKIESGQLEIEHVEFDLEELVEQVSETMAVIAHDKDLEFSVEIEEKVPTSLLGDPLRIRQIIYNLVGNAVKFTEHGHISFQVSLKKSGADQKFLIEFAISDTGAGIEDHKLDNIFNSFTQADTSVTRKFGGTGLGLNIVKKLVEKMKGQISVTSEVGKGSRFCFEIPFEGTKNWQLKKSGVNHLLDRKRVLVVDDSDINRSALSRLLTSWGAEVTTAKDGEDGFAKVSRKNARFDLALIDCRMPKMSGFDLLDLVKKECRFADLPTIMMFTSDHRSGDLVKAQEMEQGSYVVKPVRKNELKSAIRAVLSRPTHGRLLVVDDDSNLLEYIKETLDPFDIDTEFAASGVEALKIFKKCEIDAILCDVNMPEMSGLKLIAEVRKSGSEIPIIIFSGDIDDEVRARAIDLRATHLVDKPFDAPHLSQLLQESVLKGTQKRKTSRPQEKKIDERELNILVVDDSEKNQKLIEVYLKDTNYRLVMSANGEEALTQIMEKDFDLVLMDMQMPVMDGYTTTREIRKLEKEQTIKKTPIIALTAFALKGEQEKSLNAGCDAHLTKPVKRTVLLESILEKTRRAA